MAKLRKPSLAAWALNRISRQHHDEVASLSDIHQRIRQAKSGEQLQKASQQRNDQIAKLTDLAVSELAASGHGSSTQSRDRVFRTLLAVASNPEAETELMEGRLVSDVEPSGDGWDSFGLVTSAPPPTDPKEEAHRATAEARARAEQLEVKAVRAEQEVAATKEALASARRRAKQARRAADLAAEEARVAEQSTKA